MRQFNDNVFYAANGTSPSHKIYKICCQIIDAGATAILINALQVGLDTVLHLANSNKISVPIHIHRAGYDIITSGLKSIDTSCLTKLFRLSGGDIIHVGTPLGGLFSIDEIAQNINCLNNNFLNLKSSLAVFSRSCEETIDAVINSNLAREGMFLVDAHVYQSPIGLEHAIKQLRQYLDKKFN